MALLRMATEHVTNRIRAESCVPADNDGDNPPIEYAIPAAYEKNREHVNAVYGRLVTFNPQGDGPAQIFHVVPFGLFCTFRPQPSDMRVPEARVWGVMILIRIGVLVVSAVFGCPPDRAILVG